MSELWALGAAGALAAMAGMARGARNTKDPRARWVVQYLNPDGPGQWTTSSRPLSRASGEAEIDKQRDAYPTITHRLTPAPRQRKP